MNTNRFSFFVVAMILVSGCAEGPLWQTGHYVPWAKNHWEKENEIAETLQRRKRTLEEMIDQATSDGQHEQVASKLGEIINREPVLLLRLHAVSLLNRVDPQAAIQPLKDATNDPDSRIRIAAVQAWENMPSELAVQQLQGVIGSDTDVDVRLAATKALGNFPEPIAAQALSLALTDTNPAIQYRAMESLEQVTGKKIGSDVVAWQTFLGSQNQAAVANARQSIGTARLR